MPSCFVPLCKPCQGGAKPSFFSAPKDEKIFSEWKRVIPKRDDNVELSHYSKLCHRHFQRDDIVRVDLVPCNNGVTVSLPRTRVKLRKNAIPSIFPTSITDNIQIDEEVIEEKIPTEIELIPCEVEISKVSIFIDHLKLPSDSWLAKPCANTDRAVIFQVRVSADGWPLVGNSAQINLEDNSITFKVEGIRPLPDGILPTNFDSKENLEEIFTIYDNLRFCPGVSDPVFHRIPIHQVPTARFEGGTWRSLTCLEIIREGLSFSSSLCNNCYQLKRNILRRRDIPEDDGKVTQDPLKEKAESLTKENKMLKKKLQRRDLRLKDLEEETKTLRQEMADMQENSAISNPNKRPPQKRKKAVDFVSQTINE